MSAPGGFDVQRARAELPDFAAATGSPGAHTSAYLRHYGIDFAAARGADAEVDAEVNADVDTEVDAGAGSDDPPEHRVGLLTVDGERIAAHLILPPRPVGTAFILHGYFDHVGLYGHLIRYCLARGLAVATLDQPGHGLSSGTPASIDSFDRYVRAYRALRDFVAPLAPTPWHLFGQSMGGAIAMAHLLESGYRADSCPYRNIVLLAPLLRPYQWTRLRVVYHGLRWLVPRWPRTFTGNSNDPAFTTFLRDADPLQATSVAVSWVTAMVDAMRRFERHPGSDLPVLVLQGDADETVDAAHNLARIGDKFALDVRWLAGARHHLVNESAAIRANLFAHIDDYWR